MAKVKGAFFGLDASGSVAKLITAKTKKGMSVVGKYGTHKDADSPAQSPIRACFPVAIALWRDLLSSEVEQWAKYAPAHDRAWSGYHYFSHLNLARCVQGLPLLRVPPDQGAMTSCFEFDGAGGLMPLAVLPIGVRGLFEVAADDSISPATGTNLDTLFELDGVSAVMPKV